MAGQFGPAPPYATGPDVLFVAYYASAELGCYCVLGWPMPERILDLFIEFRNLTNDHPTPAGAGLLGALITLGSMLWGPTKRIPCGPSRCAAGHGPRMSGRRSSPIVNKMLRRFKRLLPAMLPHIDWPRALLRGRYMAAAAKMEHDGVPIDVPMLELLRQHWTTSKTN